MDKINEMDKLQRNDHDTLIRLEGKVDSLIAMQVTSKAELTELRKQTEANTQWIHDFKNAYRVVAFIGTLVGSLMGAVVTLISIKTEIFK